MFVEWIASAKSASQRRGKLTLPSLLRSGEAIYLLNIFVEWDCFGKKRLAKTKKTDITVIANRESGEAIY